MYIICIHTYIAILEGCTDHIIRLGTTIFMPHRDGCPHRQQIAICPSRIHVCCMFTATHTYHYCLICIREEQNIAS